MTRLELLEFLTVVQALGVDKPDADTLQYVCVSDLEADGMTSAQATSFLTGKKA
jgi:hypothetical protein